MGDREENAKESCLYGHPIPFTSEHWLSRGAVLLLRSSTASPQCWDSLALAKGANKSPQIAIRIQPTGSVV